MTDLARLCATHGIEPAYRGVDGSDHAVPEETLEALVRTFELDGGAAAPPDGIAEARAERDPPRCFVPEELEEHRVWGLTCQIPSLRSDRDLGLGDFADLALLARTAAEAGADFLGVNPLHAMFWSDPGRFSPFSPSNRRLLNPLYLAPDWIEGFAGLTPDEAREAAYLRALPLADPAAAGTLKDRVLRRLFSQAGDSAGFAAFREAGAETLRAHALFETVSAAMVRDGRSAGWMGWPEAYRDRDSDPVRRLAERQEGELRYHLWLQWQADRQLARVQQAALEAGMRIGLYLDLAVGAAPDGSATWTDPHLTVPELAIGAPPDDFSIHGQDWGLAPISPIAMRETAGAPLAEVMAAVMRRAGAVRIDHAMSLARLWLIPHGRRPLDGAYMRYPLSLLLARLAERSQAARTIVIGEDLGVVPEGFRPLMADRAVHSYKVWFFERGGSVLPSTGDWPRGGLACIATHDMATLAGWAAGADIAIREGLGRLGPGQVTSARRDRMQDRERIAGALGAGPGTHALSVAMHAHMAESPCRLAALQLEDALGLETQVNVPGTTDEYPNWRTRLPVPVDGLARHPGFRAHADAMSRARPR